MLSGKVIHCQSVVLNNKPHNYHNIPDDSENNLKERHEIAPKNLNPTAKRQKMTYDVKVRPVTYKVGDN